MARAMCKSLPFSPVVDDAGNTQFNARVQIFVANSRTYVPVYIAATGSATLPQPLHTDHDGRVPGYINVDQVVDVSVNGGPIIEYQVPAGVPGGGGGGGGGSVNVALVSDENYTMGANDGLVVMTTLTAPRTVTLPFGSLLGDGQQFAIKDGAGAAGAHPITVQGASDHLLIDDVSSLEIEVNFGVLRVTFTGELYAVL